jgi:hypothetical protein
LEQIIDPVPGIQVGGKDQHLPAWKAITGLVED